MSDTTAQSELAFVGTYTQRGSEGIYVYSVDALSGRLLPLSHVGGIQNPSFLAAHPTRPLVYAVHETGADAAVMGFALDTASNSLRPLNRQPAHGSSPCHLSVDQTGKVVVVANYSSGTVSVYPVEEDGRLGEASQVIQHEGKSVNLKRQEGPHAHSATIDPTNRFVFVADLGLDRLMAYALDPERAALTPLPELTVSVAPGAGPRHFAFHPTGPFAYLINELGNTIVAYSYDGGAGRLEELQTMSTLPEGFAGTSHCADIHVSPSGRFVYGSNRGHDSLAIYAVDQGTGLLSFVAHTPTGGGNPRGFCIHPSGRWIWVGNQDTDTIVTFAVDEASGTLTATGDVAEVSMPVCIRLTAGGC